MKSLINNEQAINSPLGVGGMKWNTSLYNEKHDFVAKYGEDILNWLLPKKGEAILDVGCGTGTLTNKIKEEDADITGIDASEDMIAKAKSSFPGIDFFVKDATDFSFDKKFDAVFSNATLHWINRQQQVLQCIYDVLKSKGRFVFEMGGKHNIESIHTAIMQAIAEAGHEESIPSESNYFPSVAEQCLLLEKVGFTVSEVAYFKRPTVLKGEDGMKNWIVQFCSFFFTQMPAGTADDIINNAIDKLSQTNYHDGIWYADYVRLRIKAMKE